MTDIGWPPRKVLSCWVPGLTAVLIALALCLSIGGHFDTVNHRMAQAEYVACVQQAHDVRDCGERP